MFNQIKSNLINNRPKAKDLIYKILKFNNKIKYLIFKNFKMNNKVNNKVYNKVNNQVKEIVYKILKLNLINNKVK